MMYQVLYAWDDAPGRDADVWPVVVEGPGATKTADGWRLPVSLAEWVRVTGARLGADEWRVCQYRPVCLDGRGVRTEAVSVPLAVGKVTA
jgi:hypothetical protein